MTKNEIIDVLNNIIEHERKHFNYYQWFWLHIKGLERATLGALFYKEMQSELEHVLEFSAKVVSLGGQVTTMYPHLALASMTSGSMLELAIEMEREVLKVYHDAFPLAERYAEEYGDMSIVLLLEENIEHTTKDVEEMEKWL